MVIITLSIEFAFFASLFSSLMGGGFGLVSVPAIYYILYHFYPSFQNHIMQITITTGLCSSATLGIISSLKNAKYGNIDITLYKKCILYMVIGGLVGAFLMNIIDSHILKKIFAVIVLLIAIWMIRFDLNNPRLINFKKHHFSGVSLFITLISTLTGIAVFNVPFFVSSGIDLRKAIGTSTLLVFTISTSIGVILTISGIFSIGVSYYHIGYLVLPIFFAAIIPSIIGSLIGTKLVNHLDSRILKAIFVTMMVMVATIMIV